MGPRLPATPSRTVTPAGPPTTDIPGLPARFQVEGRLGEGGMGEVVLAHDRLLRRRVSIKVLKPYLADDPVARTRFEREARAAAGLHHPNVVVIHDIFADLPRPLFVMELVEGHSLQESLAKHGALPPEEAIRIGTAVADALEAAHARGIIHRDVKPANVLLGDDGAIKVADFGIAWAQPWTPLSGDATVHGTPHYYSPEQARGERVEPRSDIYSLGVVLFEMLAGRVPFDGPSPVAVGLKHVNEEPPPIGDLVPGVTPALAAIVHRCLAKDPSSRFSTASEVAAGLRASGQEPVDNKMSPGGGRATSLAPGQGQPTTRLSPEGPPTRAEAQSEPRHRRGWLIAALAGGLAVLSAAAFLSWWLVAANTTGTPPEISGAIKARTGCSGFLNPEVTLDWVPPGGADGYVVYRRGTSGPWQEVGATSKGGTSSWRDTTVSGGSTYLYEVKATRAGRLGPPSRMASATTSSFCM